MRTPEGKMFRVVGEEVVEYVRHGDEIMPVTDPRVSQIIGQGILELTWGEEE